jgi:sugar phosphate permease
MPHSLRNLSQDEISDLNRKLVRKIDCIVLPIIGILYILNYIDRQNLAAAKLQGIMEDLDMTTQQFATAISILFVGPDYTCTATKPCDLGCCGPL